MIRQGNPALFRQPLGNGFHLFARKAIHHPGIMRMVSFQKLPQLLFGVLALVNGVSDIGAVEAINIDIRLLQLELFNDFLPRSLISCSGEGNTRNTGIALG